MDERLKEILSSMLDDEADELSLRRVLRQGDAEEMQRTWRNWHQMRALLRDDERPYALVDVSAAVRAELDGAKPQRRLRLPPVNKVLPRQARPWALTAMVALALGLGFGAGSQWRHALPGGSDALASADTAGQHGIERVDDSGSSGMANFSMAQLDPAQREQLSAYLLRHAQHSSIGGGRGAVGFARVASISYNDE